MSNHRYTGCKLVFKMVDPIIDQDEDFLHIHVRRELEIVLRSPPFKFWMVPRRRARRSTTPTISEIAERISLLVSDEQ
jgi:hypothetical protein